MGAGQTREVVLELQNIGWHQQVEAPRAEVVWWPHANAQGRYPPSKDARARKELAEADRPQLSGGAQGFAAMPKKTELSAECLKTK